MSREKFRDRFQAEYKTAIAPADSIEDVVAIPTGILSFDIATGIGGFPRGRIVEIFGPESGGKSLLSLISCAYAQKNFDAKGLYFDVESGTPREWLETLGLNLDNFDIITAGLSAEQNLDTIVLAIEEKAYDYIILDSVAALISSAELEGKIDKNYMAELSRVMSKGLKKIVAIAGAMGSQAPCIIFINQIREKVGVMFGSPETTPGGRALKFYAVQRYRVTKKAQSEVKDKGDVIGHIVKVTNVKNKLGPPKRTGEFTLYYTKGIDTTRSIMNMLKQRKLYTKVGQKYHLLLEEGTDPVVFDTVSDLTAELTGNNAFQLRVYNFLMKNYIGNIPVSIPEDTTDDEFV